MSKLDAVSPEELRQTAWRHFLNTETEADQNGWPLFFLLYEEGPARPTLMALWDEMRDQVLAHWVAEYPGTRPHFWWQNDAPEPRRRTGGTGELRSNFPTRCHFGVPRLRAFTGVDPDDPPTFETQAEYLQRLNIDDH